MAFCAILGSCDQDAAAAAIRIGDVDVARDSTGRQPDGSAGASGFEADPEAAWIAIGGDDAEDFLHRMLSQAIKGLAAGQAVWATMLDRKGGLIAPLRLYRLRDGDRAAAEPLAAARFLAAVPIAAAEPLTAALDAFIIVDDVTLTPLPADWGSAHYLGETLPPSLANAVGLLCIEEAWRAQPAWRIVGPQSAIVEAIRAAAGVPRIGWLDRERLRIAAGIPRFGVDAQPGMLLKEAGYEAAISYTKGCYPGQETTYRLHYRGQPAARLLQLTTDKAGPELEARVGSPLRDASSQKEIGRITSVAADGPERAVAIGLVKRPAFGAERLVDGTGGEWRIGSVVGLDGSDAESTAAELHAPKPKPEMDPSRGEG